MRPLQTLIVGIAMLTSCTATNEAESTSFPYTVTDQTPNRANLSPLSSERLTITLRIDQRIIRSIHRNTPHSKGLTTTEVMVQ